MTTPTSSAFPDAADMWNKRFRTDDYIFGTEPNEWLREQASVWQRGQRVLCVADGEGRNSVWLAAQGLRVDAFDLAGEHRTALIGVIAYSHDVIERNVQ